MQVPVTASSTQPRKAQCSGPAWLGVVAGSASACASSAPCFLASHLEGTRLKVTAVQRRTPGEVTVPLQQWAACLVDC